MIIDQELVFSDEQVMTFTTSAPSTNVIDLGPLASGNAGRNLGVGEELYIALTVDETFDDTGDNSTVTITLQTDSAEGFGSAVAVATLLTVPALAAVGTKYLIRVPIELLVPYGRYIRLLYASGNGDLSAGKMSAMIVKDADAYASYASAVATGVN